MSQPQAQDDGAVVFESTRYRLEVAADGWSAILASPAGDRLLTLRPFAALDRTDGLDETLAIEPPRIAGGSIEVERRSTLWERAVTSFRCADDALDLRTRVNGRGDLTDVRLLGGRSLLPRKPHGLIPSGSSFLTLFSPNPADPRLVRPAAEAAVIGVVGDGEPGRGHWLFTPAPLYLALTAEEVADPAATGTWLDLGLAAPVQELAFTQLVYEARDGGFALRLEYEGHTHVHGRWEAPVLVLTPGVPDPYTGLRRHRNDLVARGAAPALREGEQPEWWSKPIFCGWGAQCYLASRDGSSAPAHATQARYDEFLAELERHDLVPATVVIDDKWQAAYGTNEPDLDKWPDLKGWISERHVRRQHVLLWWKAWDPEGLAPDLCVRTPEGEPLGLDPSNPASRDALRQSIASMLGPDGLDADGLKIDFTARTPSGRAPVLHGDGWGIALLHELLSVVYRAAKDSKPDALVITHTPHPGFVDVTDMIRLNDMLGGVSSVVPQMRHRALVARAVCPELPVDTDDWRIPSRDAWREYLASKLELGIPSLYYVSHLDATGEALEPDDYEALAQSWEEWEAKRR
ncbi:MAG: hypothetical protein H0U07_01935 [Actinobacteria bacterium]|nr:hypothetical protein [Actinomycetota bacterium]